VQLGEVVVGVARADRDRLGVQHSRRNPQVDAGVLKRPEVEHDGVVQRAGPESALAPGRDDGGLASLVSNVDRSPVVEHR